MEVSIFAQNDYLGQKINSQIPTENPLFMYEVDGST